MTLEAYEHQDLPFEKLVEELQPERSLSHTPLFQVSFALQNAPMGELQLPGLTLSGAGAKGEVAKYELTLGLTEEGGCLTGALEYRSDLFDAQTISRMASHFVRLLNSIVSNPDARLDELQMLSEEETALLERPVDVEDIGRSFSFEKGQA